MKELAKERNWGIDLLRVVLAIFIAMNHIIGQGISVLDEELYTSNVLVYSIIQIVSNPAVNIFFLVSGFYGINIKLNKIFSLISMVYCWGILCSFLGVCTNIISIRQCFFLIVLPFERYWFIVAYFFLCFISKYVNISLENMTIKELHIMLGVFSAFEIVQGFLFNGAIYGDGFSCIHALYMYCVGHVIKVNINKIDQMKNRVWLCILGNGVLIIGMFFVIKLKTLEWFANRLYSYNNPLVIMQAVLSFILFEWVGRTYKVNNWAKKMLSFFRVAVLPVYMITESHWFKDVGYITIVNCLYDYNRLSCLILLLWVIVIVMLCSLIEQIRLRIMIMIKQGVVCVK